jgi:formate dehydrogenase subunit gamma
MSSGDLKQEIADYASTYAGKIGALLPILRDVQSKYGYISQKAIEYIADQLNLSRAEVYGVVTFYHDFTLEPSERRKLLLCKSEACQAQGSEKVARDLDALAHETRDESGGSSDFEVVDVYCLGLCSVAPAGAIDGRLLGRVSATMVAKILGMQPK